MIQISQCNGDNESAMENFDEAFDKLTTDNNQKGSINKVRIDMFNHEILKKDKNHQISFRDDVNPDYGLTDINLVENWKFYNIIEQQQQVDNCSCIIS